jgi:transcriptional regulator with XRE-family HTH domain
MALEEQAYITLCKEQIEKKFAFGNGNGYTQRDLELLAQHIEEKTGINLSLSTLKRLWKGHFKQSPQIATLNALAAVLDYKDWQAFKLQNLPSHTPSAKKRPWTVLVSLGVLLLIAAVFIAVSMLSKEVKIRGPIHFSAQKTVTSGIPNTVIFNYDLSHVEADSFYIQQSWNEFQRVAIDPHGNAHTSIYYESGYHRAKLYANDSLIAMQPVHILSEGWEPHIYYSYADQEPIHFKRENYIEDGQLHLSEALLRKRKVDLSRDFLTRISNVQNFRVSSDNFSLFSRMKVDNIADKLCPWMRMIVVTEKHIFWVGLQNKGCEHHASYKVGEELRFGEEHDLSALGVDVYDWQEVEMHVQDKHASIRVNGKEVFQQSFKEDFGNIMGLLYIFEGTGSLDDVKLADANGKTVFEDNFTLDSAMVQ